MEQLNALKISLCQMEVIPGKPDANTAYIIREIEAAAGRGIDIIAFPEMCTTGYLIGDIFEDTAFIQDVAILNQKIVEATKIGVTAIFGTIIAPPGQKGEDGRHRMQNAGMVAKDGVLAGWSVKTLQPDYRFFNDDKHMYSFRKVLEERGKSIKECLLPHQVQTHIGLLKIGVILCEDMWRTDYFFNPTETLVENGAELIFNLSASPWGWQKNRKRHQVVKDLLSESPVAFCYVNNTGAQNVGKNILVFDGSSAVYGADGDIIFEAPAYAKGSHDFTFDADLPALAPKPQDDTAELYAAMTRATKSIVPQGATVAIGMSGGIDSSTAAAHFVDVLGADRVLGIHMPFINVPGAEDKAKTVADALGIRLEIKPIKDLVEAVCRACNIESRTLAYENVQARARKDILAAMAQKIGGVFSCNSNKVEIAFGYGTLYGDLAGFYAPFGDLVKREIRQIADYLNKVRFGREVISKECIDQRPTAGLAEGQFDPFDYGGLDRRGYHDEMVRAFTEFRRNPEWFLELYMRGKLENELKLEPETLKKLFSDPRDFIRDLENSWIKFYGSYFKRIQSVPIPVFSKRAFGRDLEESMLSPHFTSNYQSLKRYLINESRLRTRIAVYGGRFDPPGIHHQEIVKHLLSSCDFDKVLITPCGFYPGKSPTNTPIEHHKTMIKMAFSGFEDKSVEFDFSDLDLQKFTPNCDLNDRYQKQFSNVEFWYVVGGDLVKNGGAGNSEIQRTWKNGLEVWQNLNFVVVSHPDYQVQQSDLPPSSYLTEINTLMMGRSSLIRKRIARKEPIDGLVAPEIVSYIEENRLYTL